jgi:hypothetical protein
MRLDFGLEWRLTLHCGGAALDAEEHGHYGIGDAVVEHVALPLELHLAAGAVADGHAAHDEIGGDDLVDGVLLVHVLVHLAVVLFVAVRAVLVVPLGLGQLLDAAEGALETPLDQVDAGGGQPEALLAGDGCGREAGVLAQVLGRHQRHLEVVLDQHARDELRLLGIVVLGHLHGLRDRG